MVRHARDHIGINAARQPDCDGNIGPKGARDRSFQGSVHSLLRLFRADILRLIG